MEDHGSSVAKADSGDAKPSGEGSEVAPDPMASLASDMLALAAELDANASARQEWADNPEIGGKKPRFADYLKGKRYGYSHAAQLVRSRVALAKTGERF